MTRGARLPSCRTGAAFAMERGVPPSPCPGDVLHTWQSPPPASSQHPAGSGPVAAATGKAQGLAGAKDRVREELPSRQGRRGQ